MFCFTIWFHRRHSSTLLNHLHHRVVTQVWRYDEMFQNCASTILLFSAQCWHHSIHTFVFYLPTPFTLHINFVFPFSRMDCGLIKTGTRCFTNVCFHEICTILSLGFAQWCLHSKHFFCLILSGLFAVLNSLIVINDSFNSDVCVCVDENRMDNYDPLVRAGIIINTLCVLAY